MYIKNCIKILKNDPWKKKDNTSPPDLDEIFSKWSRSIFKNKNKGGASSFGFSLIFVVIFVLWLISGFFIVAPSDKAVILRLGKKFDILEPGPHWIPRFLDTNYIVNVNKVYQFGYSAQMLTRDENIVDIELSVQYQVSNPYDFLFNVTTPINSIKEATASALRQVVGHTKLDDILTTGREVARNEIESQLVAILDVYKPGLHVVDVNLQPARPPAQVTEAFDDAIKAREDQQKYINQARAYSEKVIPISEGHAARLLEEAKAYKTRIILDSKAEIARFVALLKEHDRAPAVMDTRLYLSSLEKVFSQTNKILVDTNGSNNILYLPLDKMLAHNATQSTPRLDSTNNRDTILPSTASVVKDIQVRSTQPYMLSDRNVTGR